MVKLNLNKVEKSVRTSKPRKRSEADKQKRRESEMAKMKNRKTENLEYRFYKKLTSPGRLASYDPRSDDLDGGSKVLSLSSSSRIVVTPINLVGDDISEEMGKARLHREYELNMMADGIPRWDQPEAVKPQGRIGDYFGFLIAKAPYDRVEIFKVIGVGGTESRRDAWNDPMFGNPSQSNRGVVFLSGYKGWVRSSELAAACPHVPAQFKTRGAMYANNGTNVYSLEGMTHPVVLNP